MSEPSTSLNSDILLSILSISSPKTATSIMATCHFLYHEGAKFVLQHPVSLDGSEEKAISLLRFIQAEDFSRCSYVRTLNIVADPVAETVAKMLADIAPRMSNLVRLYFRGEQSLEAYPYLLPAFASLQSVKTLTMAEARAQSCELLKRLQSELVSATIVFSPAGRLDGRQLYIASRHPLYLLQRSASTLRELVCGFWSDSVLDSDTLVSLTETVYPNVSNLVLYNTIAPSPISYIGAFPNLTHLRAEIQRTILEESVQLGVCDVQRRLNLMIQGLFHEHLSGDEEPFAWQKIQTYTGPLSDLWALGISFPIPRLILTDVPTTRSPLALTEVLADARPIHLTITFEDQPFASVLDSDLLAALRSDGASGLRSLTLAVDVMAGDVDGSLNIDHTLTRLQTVFSGLHLKELQFVMRDITPSEPAGVQVQSPIPVGEDHSGSPDNTLDHGDAAQAAPRDAADGAPPPVVHRDEGEDRASFTLAESTLEDVDVHAFVRRLSTSIPTLENAVISIGRPRRCGGAPRTGCLGERRGVSEAHIDGVVSSLCEELQVLELERISHERGVNATWV